MRRTALPLALLILLAGAFTAWVAPAPVAAQASAAQADATTTIIFVRHAEAGGGDPKNPSLSPAGEQRAQTLVKALSSSGITAVYTSEYNRTQQTGGFVAKSASVTPVVVPASTAPATFVARILDVSAGATVLVVGHSNTIPQLVKAASGVAVDPIADTEFDHMYIVTIRNGVAHLVQARY